MPQEPETGVFHPFGQPIKVAFIAMSSSFRTALIKSNVNAPFGDRDEHATEMVKFLLHFTHSVLQIIFRHFNHYLCALECNDY